MAHDMTGDPRGQFLNYDTVGKRTIPKGPALGKEEIEENIALIKDIVPGYGEGFIEACLVACNGDAQRATNLLLEKNFPEPLKSMDPQLGRVPGPSTNRPVTETGDPRAAWMGAAATGEQPAAVDPTAAPKKATHDPAAAQGAAEIADPRAAWLDEDTAAPQAGAKGATAAHAEGSQAHYFKTGGPRAH